MSVKPIATKRITPAELEDLATRYVRVSDVQRITNASRSEVFRALYAGYLRGHQPRGSRIWLIEPSAIDEWIKGGKAA